MPAAPKIADVTSKVVDLLTPLESADRHRVVQAAFTLLGETQINIKDQGGSGAGSGGSKEHAEVAGFPAKAAAWVRQNGLSMEQLEKIFHIQDGQADVIAGEVPGKGNKGKTLNAYVLQGVSGLLASGNATFADKAARMLCTTLGCYDSTNHATFMKDKGNLWTGAKETGWQLTAPGLKQAAALIKEMTAEKDK